MQFNEFILTYQKDITELAQNADNLITEAQAGRLRNEDVRALTAISKELGKLARQYANLKNDAAMIEYRKRQNDLFVGAE